MLLKFIQLCIIFILIGGGIIVYKQEALRNRILSYAHVSLPDLPEVKGVNIGKAGSISGHLKSDVDAGVKQAQKQVMNMKISDVMNFLNRGQKIANDFRNFQDYVKEQADNYLKGKGGK